MKSFDTKIKGLWWLPEKPKEKWLGNLTTGKSRSLRLKLTVPEGYHTSLPDEPGVIHGINSNDKAISLLFTGRSSSTRSAAFTEYEYTAGYAILGFHLKNADALKLNKVTLHLQYLYDWMNRSGFLKNRERTLRRFSITYKLPKVLTFKLNTNLRLETHTWPRTRQGGRVYEVEETTDWRLCFRRPAGLREILNLVSTIRGVLHFSILRPVHLIKLEGNKNRHGTKYPEFFLPEDVEIISDLNRPDVERYTLPQDFIFTFADFTNSFADFLCKWIDYEQKFKNALGRYYTTVYHSQTSEEQHLSLTRALDAYYGIRYNQEDLNDFPRKIRELATRHHQHIKAWEPDIEAFVERVRATRHFHTHYNPKWQTSGNVLSGAKLVRLNTVLRMLFQMCVLEDMGISSNRFSRLYRQMPSKIVEYSM